MRRLALLPILAALLVPLSATAAAGAEPTAAELLAFYDQVMGPSTFDSIATMTAFREDGSSRAYEMRFLKGEGDRFRIYFQAPSAVKGQEILRLGDNLWVYLPNLKRATRIANRDSFQGGDFNNADVLRVNYTADYTATLVPSQLPETWALELKAKSSETAYDAVKLWFRKSDRMPVQGQYFGTSGQMLRSAAFSEFTELDKGFTRPARIVMQNELVKARRSEMVTKSMKVGVELPAQRFTQADLGR